MKILKVENLVKTYGSGDNIVRAVDGVSFEVERGEFVAIVGASGSGKSTLMHIIGGVDTPTSGSVEIDGQEIWNITLPIDLDRRKPDPAKLDEVLRTLGIEDKRRSLPNQLSGGQQQRVSIARAIITEPALLLADEPTGNLDSKATDDIVSLLKMTNKTFGQTIIMITHDLDIAAQADRILTISDGKLQEEVG